MCVLSGKYLGVVENISVLWASMCVSSGHCGDYLRVAGKCELCCVIPIMLGIEQFLRTT